MKGVELLRSPSGARMIKLHYSADPTKDPETPLGKEWVTRASKMYAGGTSSLGWRREMEMDPTAGYGELVFPWLDDIKDLIVDPPSESELKNCRFYGGFDVGLRNATAFEVAAVFPDKTVMFISEFYQRLATLIPIAEGLRKNPYWDRIEWIAADPALWNENQYSRDGMSSLAKMLYQDVPENLQLDKLMKAHDRKDIRFINMATEMFLSKPPKIKISKSCGMLIRELRSLKFVERTSDKNDPEKIVDKDNHCWDAAKYLLLSKPDVGVQHKKHEYGTIGHLKEAAAMAQVQSEVSGVDYQEAFSNAYF